MQQDLLQGYQLELLGQRILEFDLNAHQQEQLDQLQRFTIILLHQQLKLAL